MVPFRYINGAIYIGKVAPEAKIAGSVVSPPKLLLPKLSSDLNVFDASSNSMRQILSDSLHLLSLSLGSAPDHSLLAAQGFCFFCARLRFPGYLLRRCLIQMMQCSSTDRSQLEYLRESSLSGRLIRRMTGAQISSIFQEQQRVKKDIAWLVHFNILCAQHSI